MTTEEREIKTQFLLDETIRLRMCVINEFLQELDEYENPSDEDYEDESDYDDNDE